MNMRRCRLSQAQSKRAFTLIELLVVIAIIALLLSILMPALDRVKKQARSVACQARLRSWGLFYKLYTDDYDGKFNPGWDIGEATLWMNSLRPYYKDNWEMLFCPTAKRIVLNANDWGTFKAWFRDVDLPGGGAQRFYGSYSENSWTNYMTKDRGTRLLKDFWRTTQSVKSPENIPVFADSTWHDAWPFEFDSPPLYEEEFGWGDTGTTNEMKHFCIDRHNGWINFLFMDWSTRTVGLKELWTLKWHRSFNTRSQWTTAGGVQPSDWPAWLRKYKDY